MYIKNCHELDDELRDEVIEFLATDLSDYLTGQTIYIDGGLKTLNPSSSKLNLY